MDPSTKNVQITLERDVQVASNLSKIKVISAKSSTPHLTVRKMTKTLRQNLRYLIDHKNTSKAIQNCIRSYSKKLQVSQSFIEDLISEQIAKAERGKATNPTSQPTHLQSDDHKLDSDESDGLEEFLDAVEPNRKVRRRRKRELTKEQEDDKVKRDLQRRTCKICDMVFSIPKGLTTHMRVKHTFEKPYACDLCDERFSVQSSYALHRRRHLGIKPHLCNVCGKTFLRNTDLCIHMRTHNKVRDINCSLCSNTYSSIMSLKKHVLIKHTNPDEWKHECPMCHQKCVSTTTLNLHVKQHNEDRSFKCYICGKGFFTNQNMKVHIRTHSASTKFNCHMCTNGYRSNEALQRHLLRVHGVGEEKPASRPKYFCPVCKEGFLQKARLDKHLRLHETGEDEFPYKCRPCGRQYKARNFFVMHMNTKHQVPVDDDYFRLCKEEIWDNSENEDDPDQV